MQFVVISGRSGSGKSTALQLLEDAGFTCIDNLPVGLLPALLAQVAQANTVDNLKFAVGIDARNIGKDLSRFPEILAASQSELTQFSIVYLDASNQILIKRFSETRRKHPLSDKTTGLQEAIQAEQKILEPVARMADITIDTSGLNLHELRSVIKKQVVGNDHGSLALMFESFGFKFGVPVDADFVFDVRSLPNPFWQPDLRLLTGLEPEVTAFLREQPEVEAMRHDIATFLAKWIPSFAQNNRSYLTIAIGCTGGMHRSVFLAERLGEHFQQQYDNVQMRHRQLAQANNPVH